MENSDIDSAALRRAELRSERIRIVATLAILCLVFAFTFARRLVFEGMRSTQTLPIVAAFFAAMVVYEAVMLWWVTRALRTQSDLPDGAWKTNVVVEALFPTVGLALLIGTGVTGPYMALVAPVVLTYFLFICLSTLRLSPTLARLSGVCSSAGYALVTAYVLTRYPTPDLGSAMQPLEYYAGNTVIILVGGFVAGEVGRQIRRHVEAALREARAVERLKGDLETARAIQQGLLPKAPPQISGYEIAGWNQPADETGGDYFGWQELPDQRFAFTLADVTGHGIGAALVAATCHAYSRAGMSGDSDLGTILSRVNSLLCAELPSGKLVTYVAGALEPGTGRLELLSAGHAPLLLYTAVDDRVQSFPAHGVPFGIFDTLEYGPPQEILLAPGDILVLSTDGFFEWEDARGQEYGFERLHEAIRSARNLPAAQVIATLHESVMRFTGGTRQKDDLTAVVVKRCG
jgi:serine phosphatase RsbU (regulator of sigma subunit)